MSRLRIVPGRATLAVGLLLLAAAATACEEDSKTAPATCADPALPIYDIQGGAEDVNNPCVTPVGHAVSSIAGGSSVDTGGASDTGGTAGSSGSAGKGGTAGSGGSAGKGGAGGSGGKGGNAGTGGK